MASVFPHRSSTSHKASASSGYGHSSASLHPSSGFDSSPRYPPVPEYAHSPAHAAHPSGRSGAPSPQQRFAASPQTVAPDEVASAADTAQHSRSLPAHSFRYLTHHPSAGGAPAVDISIQLAGFSAAAPPFFLPTSTSVAVPSTTPDSGAARSTARDALPVGRPAPPLPEWHSPQHGMNRWLPAQAEVDSVQRKAERRQSFHHPPKSARGGRGGHHSYVPSGFQAFGGYSSPMQYPPHGSSSAERRHSVGISADGLAAGLRDPRSPADRHWVSSASRVPQQSPTSWFGSPVFSVASEASITTPDRGKSHSFDGSQDFDAFVGDGGDSGRSFPGRQHWTRGVPPPSAPRSYTIESPMDMRMQYSAPDVAAAWFASPVRGGFRQQQHMQRWPAEASAPPTNRFGALQPPAGPRFVLPESSEACLSVPADDPCTTTSSSVRGSDSSSSGDSSPADDSTGKQWQDPFFPLAN